VKGPFRLILALILSGAGVRAFGQTEPSQAAVSPSTGTAAAPGLSPGVLAQVRFTGIPPQAEAEARALMKAVDMAPYSDEDLAGDVGALLASGRFVSVQARKVALSGTHFRLDLDLRSVAPAPPQPSGQPARPGPPRPPWVLGEIVIEGNKRVKASVVRSQIKARAGDLYERSDLDRDTQGIDSLGQFSRVAVDISSMPERSVPERLKGVSGSETCVRLTFLLSEKTLISRIRFEGNSELSKGKLSDETALKAKDPFDRVKLREDGEKIVELYRKKGFLQASVEASTRAAGVEEVEIVHRIFEGPRSRIEAVELLGVSAFKPGKVLKQMENRRKKVFDEKKLPEDFKKIEALYKNNGYLDYELLSSSHSVSTDGCRIVLALSIREGRSYRFGETTFEGNSVLRSTDLARALDYRPGKVYSQERFDNSIRAIQELYADKGRLRAKVVPAKTMNEATGLLDIRFEVEEGRVVYIDHIDIEGNKATKTYVLRREILVQEGQIFSISKIRKSQERIMNLGFIDDVNLDIQSPVDPDRTDLTFDVLEGKPGMLTAGAGFSSLDGLMGMMTLQHMNLFGRAQRTSLQWSFGSRIQDYTASWTSMWTRGKPVSLGFDAFNTRRISPFESMNNGYTNRRTGGGVRVGPRFSDDKYHLNFNYTLQKIGVSNVDPQFADRLSEGTSVHSSLGMEFSRDTRDNYWDPSRGTRNGFGATLAGGPLLGTVNFIKPHIFNSLHHTLFTVEDYPCVLSISNRGGYVAPFGQTKQVPVFERFYVGGQDSLRGYSYSGEVGVPDGGSLYDVFNVEVGFPLAREHRKTIVKFVTFFDAGGSWESLSSARLRIGQDDRDIKTDVGFGIRFVTPAFPIRLDWGYGFNHKPGEQRYQINFGIGSLF
jgi:outer membrane protein insertion porin family